MRAHSWFTVTVHCHYTLSMYTVNAVTVYYPCTWYTVFWHCTLSLHTAHCHCTLSLYTITVHCHYTLYTVHCTLYTVLLKVPYNVSPHTVRPPQRPSLYTSTLHCHSTRIVCSHYKLSLYTVTVHCHCKLGAVFFGRGWMVILAPLFVVLYPPPPPHSYSLNPKNSCSHSESCNSSLRHSQGHTH